MEPTYNNNIEEQELAIIESGTDISDEQVKNLAADGSLLRAVRRLNDAATLLDGEPVDVEGRLASFHASHRRRRTRMVWIAGAFAVAAALASFFILVPVHETGVNLNDSPISYHQVAHLKEVTVFANSGKPVKKAEKEAEEGSFSVLDAKPSDVVLTAAVPSGSSYEVTLADGSKVYLHSNSRLVFPTQFTGRRREVLLDGEGYFVVTHDSEHPFIVHAGKFETEVLGTEFYVRAHNNLRDNVTLVDGKVKVSGNGGDVVIMPGQQVYNDMKRLAVRQVDLTPYKYWRDGYLFFDHESVRKIIEDIAADYNYAVEYKTDKSLDYELRFTADRTRGIGEVLTTLNELAGINSRLEDGKIVVR